MTTETGYGPGPTTRPDASNRQDSNVAKRAQASPPEMLRYGRPDVDEARGWIIRLHGETDHRLDTLQTVIDDVRESPPG